MAPVQSLQVLDYSTIHELEHSSRVFRQKCQTYCLQPADITVRWTVVYEHENIPVLCYELSVKCTQPVSEDLLHHPRLLVWSIINRECLDAFKAMSLHCLVNYEQAAPFTARRISTHHHGDPFFTFYCLHKHHPCKLGSCSWAAWSKAPTCRHGRPRQLHHTHFWTWACDVPWITTASLPTRRSRWCPFGWRSLLPLQQLWAHLTECYGFELL